MYVTLHIPVLVSFLSRVLLVSVRLHFETFSSTVGANSTTSSRLACLKREESVERTPWSNVIPCIVLTEEGKKIQYKYQKDAWGRDGERERERERERFTFSRPYYQRYWWSSNTSLEILAASISSHQDERETYQRKQLHSNSKAKPT